MAVMSSSIHICDKENSAFFNFNLPNVPNFISLDEVKALKNMSMKSARFKLARILKFDNYEVNIKNSILTDYYFSGFWWAKSNLVQPEKIVTFMELLLILLKNLTDLRLNEEENLKFLKTIITSTVETSSHSSLPFSVKEAQDITEFLMTGLFQHYKLYECCFRRKRPKGMITQELEVETIAPEILQSLSDAMDEESVLLAKQEFEPKHPQIYVGSNRHLSLGKTFLFTEIHG